MKYMILTYGSQQEYDGIAGKGGERAWSPEEFAAMTGFMTDLNKRLEESGELVETRGLANPVHTRRLSGGLRGGVPVVTDGPYAETQEVLAGYWVVECASFDRATEIAAELAKCPAPAWVTEREVVDVRPITEAAEDIGP